MSKTIQGTRLNDNCFPKERGEYSKQSDGTWLLCLPTGIHGQINNKTWKIVEHDNNTITVTPSILTTTTGHPELTWHGYLEAGIWREC
ncbi:MAG: hypothetical protein CVU71_01100 [Deltaproteobacteria bacterium HGW-Deltaproteobacteria-6]|jgi:hypothetical protein|nr:MAG: hypothetical protein CVU71_01100 [Deltaproteobacteria bacterium HGW-Deltaproteobacteria-6]